MKQAVKTAGEIAMGIGAGVLTVAVLFVAIRVALWLLGE